MSKTQLKRVMYNPCINASLKDGARMIAFWELIFSFGYVFHGINIWARFNTSNYIVYGILYTLAGVGYGFLGYLLWMVTIKPNRSHFVAWIAATWLLQLLIFAVTVSRCATEYGNVWFVEILWIPCGIFLQFYFFWVVWALMLEDQPDSEVSNNSPFVISASGGPPTSSPIRSDNVQNPGAEQTPYMNESSQDNPKANNEQGHEQTFPAKHSAHSVDMSDNVEDFRKSTDSMDPTTSSPPPVIVHVVEKPKGENISTNSADIIEQTNSVSV